MAIKPPSKIMRLYTIPEAAEVWHVSAGLLYKEIRAGRLHAKMRRGNKHGYLVTEQIMEEWINSELDDVYEVNFASEFDKEAMA